jgi:hypothetical protein
MQLIEIAGDVGLVFFAAKVMATNCVLSPISAKTTIMKAAEKAAKLSSIKIVHLYSGGL